MMRQLRKIFHRTLQQPTQIYFVSDGQNWAFDWVAHYLIQGLKEISISAVVESDVWDKRNAIIHFGDRYQYLEGTPNNLHPSNYVFLTWFHGDPAQPEFATLGNKLQQYQHLLDGIVTSCSISQKQLVAFGIPQDKIKVIPIGVDTTHFLPATPRSRQAMRDKLGIAQDAICIGSFQKDGNGWDEGLEPKRIKGPDIFLDVIERLQTRYKNLHILLTGPARGYVKRGLERLGIPYTHHFLDDYLDIATYYHALDLYIITSRVEGGPKAMAESWCSGVPVVSTRVGMPADYVRHGENGFLTEINDVEALVNYAGQLIDDKNLRVDVIQQGLQDVRTLDWMTVAKVYFEHIWQPIHG